MRSSNNVFFCFSDLNLQSQIISFMFRLVESGFISVPLSGTPNAQQPIAEVNTLYLQSFLCNLLKNAFPHLNEYCCFQLQYIDLFLYRECIENVSL